MKKQDCKIRNDFMKKKYKYLRVSIVFFTFICLFLYFKLEKIRDLVNIIIISCVISYILKPVRNKLKEKLNINNKKATIIIFIFTLVFFLCILFIVIPIMYNEF
ncbi:MAG: AI-2E family transporter, partial [Clostridiales bacterium]|nr:AI-2E family transporter [Clostridiales bacterium]